MKRTRAKLVRVYLTAEALKKIESSAFENCRTISQELSYMIEKQLKGKIDGLGADRAIPAFVDTRTSASSTTILVNKEPTEEQKSRIADLVERLKMSEAQIKATWLICETPDRVIAQLEEDLVQESATIEAPKEEAAA